MASPHPLESPTNHIDSATPTTLPAERQLRSILTPTPSSFPKSRYYTGPPSPTSSPYNTPPPPNPQTLIGHVPPRSIIRIERDYTHSASHVPQFYSAFPLELDKRVSPTECTEVVNDMNEMLVKANSTLWAGLDNAAAVFSLWVWPLVGGSHYERCMDKLTDQIAKTNTELLNPRGLHLIHPAHSAFLFLEIEYY